MGREPLSHPSIAQRLARLLTEKKAAALLPLLLITGTSLAILPYLEFDSGAGPFFQKDSSYHLVLDKVQEHFISDELLFVVYQSDNVFSRKSLEVIRALGRSIEEFTSKRDVGEDGQPLRLIEDVTSLATVKTLVGSEMSFRTVDVAPDPLPSDEQELAAIRQRALNNPILRDQLFSDDERSGVLVARLANKLSDPQQAELVAGMRALVEEARRQHPDMRFHVSGDPLVGVDGAAYQSHDLVRFIPIVYAAIILLLYAFLRRVRGVLLALVNVTLSLMAGMAVLTAIGSNVNNCSVLMPPLMMALAVATIVHYFAEYGKNSRKTHLKSPARATLAEVIPPVFMASLTTGIGFASLSVSNIPAVHDFGIAAGSAMLALFVLATCLVALAMWRWPSEKIISERGIALSEPFDGFLSGLATLLEKRRKSLLAGSLIFTAVMTAGVSRIVVDQNMIEFFPEDAPLRIANNFMEEHISGTTVFVISVRGDEPNRFQRPEELAKIDALEGFLEHEMRARPVTSIVDYMKLMHREFFAGDAKQHRIPDTAEQIAQLMLINGDTTVDEYIDSEHQWVRVVARTDIRRSAELAAMFDRIDAYLAEHFPASAGYEADATGESRLWSRLFQDLISSQLMSLAVSIVLIFGLMFLMFRSFKTGLYSIVPNVFPIVVTLGLMGWLGIQLDTATVMIATVALGIAVDDTVHFLSCYRGFLIEGRNPEEALRATLHTKGPAIIMTTAAISIGFSVLMIASYTPTQHFGILTAVAMVSALIGDVILLPSMLLVTRTRLGVKPPSPV